MIIDGLNCRPEVISHEQVTLAMAQIVLKLLIGTITRPTAWSQAARLYITSPLLLNCFHSLANKFVMTASLW